MADDFIELIKRANRIEDVIGEMEPLAHKRGRYINGKDHDSLVIDTQEQYYVWNSKNESGDVFSWLEKRKGWDFKTAAEWLARRAKLPTPEWGQQDNATRIANRAKEDALTIAARWMVKKLRDTPAAVDYCHGRGWSDETIQKAGIGYWGGSAADRKDLEGDFDLNGIDRENPGRKAVLGIPPGMLVYPHVMGGRVRYLSCRGITEKKHYNLPVDLAGSRQVFFNHIPGDDSLVIVEGQADAITFGQWGFHTVAMAGTAWKDHGGLLKEWEKRYKQIYLAMDADEAGKNALLGKEKDWPLERALGPMVRVLMYSVVDDPFPVDEISSPAARNDNEVKDANDLLKYWSAEGLKHEDQVKQIQRLRAVATPMVIWMAKWAGGLQGAEQDEAFIRVMEAVTRLDGVILAKYRQPICDAMKIGVREFNNMLKSAKGLSGEDGEAPIDIVETLGGWIGEPMEGEPKRGWLVDYIWDEDEDKAQLVYRDPSGKIGVEDHLDINGVRYIPKSVNSLVRNKGILFPSKLGQLHSTRELVATVEAFINQHYLLDDRFFGRLAAYYVMLTWLYDCFNAIPYLRAMGDYGSGKSQLMMRIGHVCYRTMSTGGAGTAASLFRALEEYRGTAFMDEMDLQDGGDMANDLIKILNLGAMKGSPVWRLDANVLADGTKNYEVAAYDIFGPKLIAMRKDFRDQAVSSRCLTIKLMGKEPIELKNRGIKLHLDEAFYKQALNIRNLLLRWRLEKWKPEIEVSEDLMDIEVPARLNQVTMPIKAIAKDDPELMNDIVIFVRSLNEELILERSMGLDARVVEALVGIKENAKYQEFLLHGNLLGSGDVDYALAKNVALVANLMMDDMNVSEDEGNDGGDDGKDKKRRKKEEIRSQTVSRIVRVTLQMKVHRTNKGFAVILDEEKLAVLKVKYGLMSVSEVKEIMDINQVAQERLL
jgi:hypothetical protein